MWRCIQYRSNGETDIIVDASYGIISNACLDAFNLCVNVFGEKGKNIQNTITNQFKIKDFYCSIGMYI